MITASSRLKRYSFEAGEFLACLVCTQICLPFCELSYAWGRTPPVSCRSSLFGFRNKPAGGLLNSTLDLLQLGVAVYFMLYVNEYDSGITNGTALQNDTRS
jgi:hypothetical protein